MLDNKYEIHICAPGWTLGYLHPVLSSMVSQYHYFRSSWHIEIQQLQQHQHNGSTPFWKSTSFTEIPFVTWNPPIPSTSPSSPEVEHEAAKGTPNPLEQYRSPSATLEVWNFCVFFFQQGKDQTGLNQKIPGALFQVPTWRFRVRILGSMISTT